MLYTNSLHIASETIVGLKARMSGGHIFQEDLALAMGIDPGLMSRILSRKRPMPEGFIKKAHTALAELEEEKRVAEEAVQTLRAERATQEARERVLAEEANDE